MTRFLQVTLTTAGEVYDLVTLIEANTQIAVEIAADALFPHQVAQIIIQADGGKITPVDANSDSNIGPTIADGESAAYGPGSMNILDLKSHKFKGDSNATKANLCIIAV